MNFSMEETTVKSTLSGGSTSNTIVPVGCIPGTAGGDLQDGNGSAISFTGYLALDNIGFNSSGSAPCGTVSV